MVPAEDDCGVRTAKASTHHVCFAVLSLALGAVTFGLLSSLLSYSLRDDSASHIILIPFITAFLIFTERKKIFSKVTWSASYGLTSIAGGLAVYYWFSARTPAQGSWSLSAATMACVIIWLGAFLFCYGPLASRTALFPLVFLFLLVPWPEPLLSRVIYFLQQGSAEIAYLLFRLTGVPVLRNGVLLSVPGVTIEVAQECSSIRSSIALFITCLLAAHYSLRKAWRVSVFVALAVIFSVIKNGFRIATLTLLSIYVDPSFLHGSLHRDGGILFFLLALAMLWPVLIYLQKSEAPTVRSTVSTGT